MVHFTYITLSAVVACLHTPAAAIARVDEVGSLVVEFIQHGLSGGLGSTEGGELPVPLAGHGEEGVAAIHEVTWDELVWVYGTSNGRVAY